MEKILVIAPHPDDETFGCGGMMLKMKSEGKKVYVLNMTDMNSESGYTESDILKRSLEIKKMISLYALDGYYNLKLNPAQLESYPKRELIAKVSGIVSAVKPDTVVLPYKSDIHSDHRVTFDICYACTKNFRYPYIKNILMMEVSSETNYAIPSEIFSPNFYVDVSQFMDKKIEIASIFDSEIHKHPFPRSGEFIEALGVVRGAVAQATYAEAFEIVKMVYSE